jgi:hypothetical protein
MKVHDLLTEAVFTVKPIDRAAAKKPSTLAKPVAGRILAHVESKIKARPKVIDRLNMIRSELEAAAESGVLSPTHISPEVHRMIMKRLAVRDRVRSGKPDNESAKASFARGFFNAIASDLMNRIHVEEMKAEKAKRQAEEQAKAERAAQRKADNEANQSLQRRGRRNRRASRRV